MTEKILDSLKILEHIEKINVILIELMATREAITSLEIVRSNYIYVEQRMTSLINFDALIESAGNQKKRKRWNESSKKKVWHMRFVEKQKPRQIALEFDATASQISNLIQQMKLEGYVHHEN